MRRTFLRMTLVIGLVANLMPRTADTGLAQPSDFDILGGHFFTQAAGGAGRGFAVLDDDRARFWTEFRRLGGVEAFGFPISQRFLWQGFISQAFQRGVIQWRPDLGEVALVNVFDLLHVAGHDDELLLVRQVPPQSQFDEAGLAFEDIASRRLAILSENAAIQAKYFAATGDPVQMNGLPTSPVIDMGDHFVLRAQRATFQQWKVDVPWASAGDVTVALGGDIAKELDLLPDRAALQPIEAPAALDEFEYPDLRTLVPREISLGTETIGGQRRFVVRFTNAVWNAGEGPLELHGISNAQTQVFQRVYGEQGTFTDRLAGEFIFHPRHDHWHFEDFAHYELWNKAAYDHWLASGRVSGQADWMQSKVGFCLLDLVRVADLPGSPPGPVYLGACGAQVQGISIGWSDVYESSLVEQWIEVGAEPLPDGDYVLRSVVDPLNLIHESSGGSDPARESAQDNEAEVVFSVSNGVITLRP